jgi:hypothetical protein
MDGPAACRPLSLYVTDPSQHFSFGVTNEPGDEHGLPAPEAELSLEQETLQRVADALAATDVSYL